MDRLKLLLTWLALPIYIWQGIGVRLRTERLLPPDGSLTGRLGGEGEPLQLLVLGDSSAAGVGVRSTDHNLATHLARSLNHKSGRPVVWRTAGFNSATSGQIRDFVVPNLAREQWTHVALSIGTNDIKNVHTLSRFKREFGGLLYALRARFPQAQIYWTEALDMRRVPALPHPLSALLEIRARAFNRLGNRLCAERGAVAVPRLPDVEPEGFASDGFHAGADGYQYWAEYLASAILGEPARRPA
ncbi:MAG: SGNH/GDSL hydrolase family protein [Rhizobiaceae bacterium]